jgi:aminoglycoside phosphotransferase (APT) family kinase protein
VISVSDEKVLRQYLLDRGLAAAGEQCSIQYLTGGVSCEVVRVKTRGREFIIKQALPKLRVKEDWFSDIRRVFTEKDCLSVYYRLVPESTPELFFCDDENYLFGMEAAPVQAEMWKQQLMRGTINFRSGSNVARALATVHNATNKDAAVRERFKEVELFIQLRIDPYWNKIAERHPQLAKQINDEIERNLSTKLALVHGDYSPKNILVTPERLYILDFECAHFGDPAYDVGFITNQLMLKAVKNKAWAAAYLNLMTAMVNEYFGIIDFIDRGTLEANTVRTLAFLFLARVDGKSPAEYITSDEDKELIRNVSYSMVRDNLKTYEDVVNLMLHSFGKTKENHAHTY